MKRLFAVAATVAILAGCASGPSGNLPLAPQKAAQADYKYKIGPGDNLSIIVWRNPELSGSYPVRPDGKFTSPLIEDLTAIGKDSTTLAREIEEILKKYIRDPIVTVIVAGGNGPYSEQVRIIGAATRPTALAYRQNMTLLDAMIAVGGITEFAAGNRTVLLRPSDDDKQYVVRLDDLVKRGDVSANVDLRPGDVLIIPESWF